MSSCDLWGWSSVVSCSNINGYLRNYQDCLTLRPGQKSLSGRGGRPFQIFKWFSFSYNWFFLKGNNWIFFAIFCCWICCPLHCALTKDFKIYNLNFGVSVVQWVFIFFSKITIRGNYHTFVLNYSLLPITYIT
jgi:hypothetical protein